ncbi:hypothetical protein J2Z31_002438 [Sinorhizobium kostiense]|uniref:Transmembrane protein n=1 Tax=Sinorhizobium kostiense TaxID=76747 RepID=A0ABS4R0M4_9HYPH|nr:hypothetical protein [Sinorhizobium kostiense]MBP2235946.1 hypothetical protein [Sinorhizobium kostiense]
MLNLANRSILNKTFLADGVFSLITGMVLIVDAPPLAALAGPAISPIVMAALGMGLLLWGAFHLVSARKGGPNIFAARISIGGDILWQIGSVTTLALAYGSLSAIGVGLIIIGMIGVADFLYFKLRGIGQTHLKAAA